MPGWIDRRTERDWTHILARCFHMQCYCSSIRLSPPFSPYYQLARSLRGILLRTARDGREFLEKCRRELEKPLFLDDHHRADVVLAREH